MKITGVEIVKRKNNCAKENNGRTYDIEFGDDGSDPKKARIKTRCQFGHIDDEFYATNSFDHGEINGHYVDIRILKDDHKIGHEIIKKTIEDHIYNAKK